MFFRFSISLLCGISWPFLHEKNLCFRKEFLDGTFFYSVHTFARIRTLLFKILGDGFMGRPPPQIWGDRPPSSPIHRRSPPMLLCILKLSTESCWTRTSTGSTVGLMWSRLMWCNLMWCYSFIHSFIHSFMLNIYIAPLHENYSKALLTPARFKRTVLSIGEKETQVKWFD